MRDFSFIIKIHLIILLKIKLKKYLFKDTKNMNNNLFYKSRPFESGRDLY